MIGKLKGLIDSKDTGYVLLDVNGVGYVVFASPRTLSALPGEGEATTLFIDTHVREDHIHLYGFIDQAEQLWFRLLTTVQGVGAKVALSILGVCPPEKLQIAIAAQDKAVITQADGVGPKLAVRILTELKDKAGNIATSTSFAPKPVSQGGAATAVNTTLDQDAVSALINLGYGKADAFSAVMRVRANDNDTDNLSELIKLALKELTG
ncbi:MAG: Holliday junction branch migration protein RuvA [Pseudobdellovibrionaceae bacterium]